MKLSAEFRIELEMDKNSNGQNAVAFALACAIAKHLQHGADPHGGFTLPRSGPYASTSGTVNWDIKIDE
jgi:hypothetical protein